MASILDEIRAEVETELSQQPQEEKPTSVLEDVKQEVTAEPLIEKPKSDFFESAEKWLEPAPTQKSSGDIFLGLISNKRANELDDEDKGLFNALSDEEQYKVAQARKDIPLDDAQARRIFEIEKSKMPSIPTSWEDWYNLGGDAFDTAKNVLKIGAKVGLGAAEFGRDIVKATDMTVADEEALNNLKKAKSSFYSFMAPAFEIPESVAWATQKAKEGGFGWADAAGEKLGLVTPEDRFENWKGRRLVSQAQAEYFREHPTVYGRMLDNPLAKDALAYIAKSEMESPEELAKRTNISVEEAKAQQDVMAREQIDKLTSQMESELPEEKARVRIAGEFLLPGELGMGTMGFISGVAKAGTGVAKGLKYIGKSADEIAEINKAAQALQKTRFAEMMKKRTERAEAVARGAGKVEKAIEGLKPAAEKVNKALGNITAPVLGGVAGYSVSDESPVTGILSGVLGGVAARGVLKGTKVGLEIPTFVRELAEARKVAPLGKTFETLGKSAEGSALKAKILSRGGKTIDNILSNSVEYARSGIHGTTLALATGALESADPEEMKQMLADGLAITLGGRALQHIKGKMMGNDPIIAQRERISEDSRIHRRYQEADPETQANLDQISDFDNAIAAKQAKLNESESELANLMATYKGSGSDAKNLKLAQSKVEVAKAELDKIKRANIQTRNEFGREFLRTYANLQDITNGVLKTGQNNVGFNILSTDQIYQRLRNDPANNNVPDADLVEIASQAGFYSNPAQEGIVFDRKKPSIVLNADSIRERVRIFGETPIQALVHETGHFMDVVPEFQESLSGVRSMLFQNEIRDAAGNIKATTPGIFSKAKLVELFSDGYLRHLDPQGQEAFAKLNKLWDESRGQLDENKVADYMKREVMADLLGEVSSRHLSKDLDSATLAMWDRARIKAKKNLLDRAINRFYGLGGRGDIVTAANTRAEFTPEAMAAARDAMRQIVALNGEISPPVQEPDMPKISKAQMMKNSALLNRFGKDSPLFKTEFKVKVFDKDGNQIGESMPVTTPNPREGTFQNTDVGMKKLSGYGDIPVEAQGLQVPEGGTLVVSRDLVMQPDGVTPVMYDAKDAKKVAAERRKLITEALDTDDYGTPNRFEPVSEGSETYRGTFTPAQIKAIQDMPESLIPKTLKENMLKMNEAIARGDGTRFIVDYAAVMNDNGKYQAFSPKMYDLVPIGMHLSKAGNFLVTTISVGRIFDKMRLWNERMPGRLRFWDNNLERTFDDFSKYLNNWQQGKAGETGLDADPQIALQKKNIFNDLLSLYDSATEYTNLDRTTIPRRKGDPRGKDPNRTIMSIRVDHIAELLPNENATKLPVNYGFAKINFMPERMEGEVPKQENDKRKNIGISFMPAREEDYAYRGEHKAPDQENGSPLHEVTKTIYPPDFYTLSFDKALQYYGSGDDVSDRESLSAILSAKGKANAKVKVYRAVPKYIGEVDPAKTKEIEDRIEKYSKLARQNPWSEDFKKQLEQALSERPQQISSINAGDWVTPSRSYAVDHGESALKGEYRILSKSVPASHLFTEGNSLSEFGYNPPAKKGIQFMPERPIEEERIVAATYTDPRTGEVREGVNHKAANPNAPDEQTDRESRYYGFKTDTGRVVDREEAYRIAEASGQLKEATSEEDRFNADRGVLHSNMVEMEPTIGEKTETSPKIGEPTIREKTQTVQESLAEANARKKLALEAFNKKAQEESFDSPEATKLYEEYDAIRKEVRDLEFQVRNPGAKKLTLDERDKYLSDLELLNEGVPTQIVEGLFGPRDTGRRWIKGKKIADSKALGDKFEVEFTGGVLFRGVTKEDWERIQKQGYIDTDGRGVISPEEEINLATSVVTAETYIPHGKQGVVLAIDPTGLDLFMIGADDYLRASGRIPIDNVVKVSGPIGKDSETGTPFIPSETFTETKPTISEKPKSSEMIGADMIKPADIETSAKPATDAVIKPYSNALVSSAGLINFLPAYHGTPHEIPVEEGFKMSKVGTGEGAQAYGYGLYFAQARQVGEEYRKKLSGDVWRMKYKDGSFFGEPYLTEQEAKADFNDLFGKKGRTDIEVVKVNENAKGNLYKVDIDVKDEDLLDWDGNNLKDSDDLGSGKISDSISKKILGWENIKSIEDFEQKLKEAEREFAYGGETGFYNLAMNDARLNDLQDVVDYWAGAYVNGAATGERIYNYLSATTSPKQASEYLNSIGIPGIRYLDGISRKQGEGTYNYVIFDENLIKILDKNDKPVEGDLPKQAPLAKGENFEVSKSGDVFVDDITKPVKFTKDIGLQFMPARPEVNLEDYIDKPIIALTADRMGVGKAYVGPKGAEQEVSQESQGGPGFSFLYTDEKSNPVWGFTRKEDADRFVGRITSLAKKEKSDSVLVAPTLLSPDNHLHNPTGQLGYAEAIDAAIKAKLLDSKLADSHIEQIMQRVAAGKGMPQADKDKFSAIKSLADFTNAVKAKEINFRQAAVIREKAAAKTLPISVDDMTRMGILPSEVAKNLSHKGFYELPTFSVVSLFEVPANQKPEKGGYHYSYPWIVRGNAIGFLKNIYNLDKLTSAENVRSKKTGELSAQPVMVVMPQLDPQKIQEASNVLQNLNKPK